ncbi:MAG: ATP-binding protein, partial [Methylococcaceae bacterium]
DELWEDTQGQPWLVNAMGYELTWKDKAARDRNMRITLEHYSAARERLIQSRATHLDQLTDKLREERVHRVVAALMQGEAVEDQVPLEDMQYVEDLGLITTRPQLRIANRIYRETIPRELTWTVQVVLPYEQAWYVTPEHRLDMPKLLAAFQQFFREHADAWLERFDYKEAGPQLLLQAFLQRVVNGGGRINREYGLGRRRTDLLLEWPLDEAQGYHGPVQRVVMELKLLHKSLQQTLAQGLPQTADYADRCGAAEAHLLIFDRRSDACWDEKIWQRTETHAGRTILVWGA